MADSAGSAAPTAAEPQAGSAAAPQAGTPTTPSTAQAAAPAAASDESQADESGSDTLSRDEARKLRSEAAAMRRRLRELEDAKKAEDDAKLSEHERLLKRAAELEAQIAAAQAAGRLLRTRLAVEREARALRLVDEDAAYRLLDADAIEYDAESGEPKNVRALLKKLADAKPWIVAPAPAPAPDTGASATPEAAGGLTFAQSLAAGTPLAGTPRPDGARELAAQEQQRLRAGVWERARAAV